MVCLSRGDRLLKDEIKGSEGGGDYSRRLREWERRDSFKRRRLFKIIPLKVAIIPGER